MKAGKKKRGARNNVRGLESYLRCACVRACVRNNHNLARQEVVLSRHPPPNEMSSGGLDLNDTSGTAERPRTSMICEISMLQCKGTELFLPGKRNTRLVLLLYARNRVRRQEKHWHESGQGGESSGTV